MRFARPAALTFTLALVLAQAFGFAAAHARQQGQQPDPADSGVKRPGSINVAPFISLVEAGRKLVEQGRLGAGATLDMSVTAELEEDGSLKPESVVVEWRSAADEDVYGLAQQAVTAVSGSKLLVMLDGHAKTVRLDARLDAQNVTLGLETELLSEEEASKWAIGYDAIIAIARKTKAGTHEGTVYDAMKITSEGKAFRVTFEMPKEAAAKMAADLLDKRAARGAAANQD